MPHSSLPKLLAFVCVFAFLFSAAGSNAQVMTADITGTVTDSTGAVLAGAKVTLKNVGTGAIQTQQTGSSGDYTFALLTVGTYSVTIESAGFKTFSQQSVVVAAGDRARVDAQMQVGSVNQTVEVSGNVTAALQTDSTTLGGLVDSHATQDVPLNGRNPTTLIQLVPGANEGTQGGGPQRPDDRRQTSQVVVNGQSGGNNWLLDGLDNNERSIGTVIVKPSIDAIEEIKVDTNLYSAAVGRVGGGVINMNTRAGTNDFHGTAYEFLRNQITDAKSFFNNPQAGNPLAGVKPPFHQNQFGGSLGGPIVKNKLFFFADLEELRTIQGLTQVVAIPSACELTGTGCPIASTPGPGNFSDLLPNVGQNCTTNPVAGCIFDHSGTWYPNNIIPASQVSSVAANYAKLFPSVSPSNCSDTQPGNNATLICNFISSPSYNQYGKTGDLRIDYHFNDKDSLFGRYTINDVSTNWPSFLPNVTIGGISVAPGGQPNVGGGSFFPGVSSQRAQSYTLGYQHIFRPNLLMQLNASLGRYTSTSNAPNATQAVNTVAMGGPINVNVPESGAPGGLLPGTGGLALLAITNYAQLGKAFALPTNYYDTNYLYAGTMTWTSGPHSVKFGASILRRDWSAFQTLTPIQFSFGSGQTAKAGVGGNSFASMLEGFPSQISRNMALIAPQYRDWEIGEFIQDDWHALRWLTVNLGLRYDIFTPFQEKHNEISDFDPTIPSVLAGGKILVAGQSGVSPTINIPTQKDMFQPRVGFAATIGHGMVVRGGFGTSFFPGNSASPANLKNAPFVAVSSFTPSAPDFNSTSTDIPFPSPVSTCIVASCGQTAPVTISDAESMNYKNSLVEMYNLNVQKQFGANVMTIGYVGEQTHNLAQVVPNLNLPLPPQGPGGCGVSAAIPLGRITGPGTVDTTGPNGICQPYGAALPLLGSLQFLRSAGHNNYNAAQAIFERRFSHGLTVSANYTFSHMLSNVASSGGACGTCQIVFNNPHYDWGNGDFDTPHRIAATANYQLPFGKSSKGVLGQLVKGWQVNGLYSYESGLPFTVSENTGRQGSAANMTDRPNAVPQQPFTKSINEWFNISNFTLQAFGTPGNEARNQFFNPSEKRFDFSIFKTFAVTERINMQFRTEVFNLTNTPSFGAPNATISGWTSSTTGATPNSANLGRITATNSFYNPRQFQFALKLTF